MSTDPNKLPEVESLAALQFSEAEIALYVGVTAEELAASDELTAAIARGRMKAEMKIRKAVFDKATAGDAQAQKQWLALTAARRRTSSK